MITRHWSASGPVLLHLILPALLTALVLGAAGCAPRTATLPVQPSADAAWKVFRRAYCRPPARPAALIKGSLYYTRVTPTRRTNRTLFSMWGDFDGPMRLDVSAGVGTLLAHIREDDHGLLVFYPEQKTAYAHADPVLGATRLGMPFPFSLNQLARACMGDFAGLTPRDYAGAEPDATAFSYTVDKRLKASRITGVTLDRTGRPLLIQGSVPDGRGGQRAWRLEINTYEETGNPPMPGRLTLAMDDGEKGVLRITARELKVAPWPARATGLELPDGVRLRRLDAGSAPEEADIPVVYEDKR
jgi:hypothetical protein